VSVIMPKRLTSSPLTLVYLIVNFLLLSIKLNIKGIMRDNPLDVKAVILPVVDRILIVPRFYLLLICFYSSYFQDSQHSSED